MERIDLQIYKANDVTFEIQLSAEEEVLDITGYTVFFTVKEYLTDSDSNAKISKTITSHSDASSGKTLIELTNSDTNLDVGSYVYDIKVKTDEDKLRTLVMGSFLVVQSVTNRQS